MSVIIRLQNLPMSANASNIRRFFGGLSIPEGGVHIVGGADGDAFIAFATDEDARKAMLLDRQLINGASVRLLLSSKTEMQSVIDSARSSVLLPAVLPTTSHQAPPPQHKTQTMQALDVTSTTLPSTFSSYRHEPSEYISKPPVSYVLPPEPAPVAQPSFEPARMEAPFQSNPRFVQDRVPNIAASFDRPAVPSDQDYGRNLDIPFKDFAGPPSRPFPNEHPDTQRPFPPGHLPPSPISRPVYTDELPRVDERYGMHERNHRAYIDSNHRQPPFDVENRSPRQIPERMDVHRVLSPAVPDAGDSRPYHDFQPPWQDRRPYPPPPPTHGDNNNHHHLPGSRPTFERDFSVRPPWLSNDTAIGSKRAAPPVEIDDYSRKRKPPLPPRSVDGDGDTGETDFVIRVTLPLADVAVKTVFELFRGVYVIPKWGIRIEEDTQQRPTGYIFIMLTSKDSMDRALANDRRLYRGKQIFVKQSSLTEFYNVSDSSFQAKCPPHILKRLPQAGQKVYSPYYADGCLEIGEIPPDASKNEIIRFLGAPGLTPMDVVIANFGPSDKETSVCTSVNSVRALVTLPSADDLDILLSAKARPLRPDGLFPPVRLTAISKAQFDAYSNFSVDSSQKSERPLREPTVIKQDTSGPLTCAYLSGFSRPLKESEVLLIFKTVLIPGDSVRMVGPANVSAYIDFISENNCRRAIADVNGPESTVKNAHPNIKFESISRAEMEHRLMGPSQKETDDSPVIAGSVDNRVDRSRDTNRPPWVDSRYPPKGNRHSSSAQLPPPMPGGQLRLQYSEPPHHYDRENGHRMDSPYGGGPRRFRQPFDGGNNPQAQYPMPLDNMPPMRGGGDAMTLPAPPPRRSDLVTIRLGNLPPSITVEQLASMMRDYYFVPGSIRLRRDMQGMFMGEGLVDFSSTYDGDRAIRDFHGYRIAGRPLMLHYDRRP